MLAACAARVGEQQDLVWVDLGGGTGVCPLYQSCEQSVGLQLVSRDRNPLLARTALLEM